MSLLDTLFKKRAPSCGHSWQELSWYLETDDEPIFSGVCVDFCYYHRLVATYICTKCGQTREKVLSCGHTEDFHAHNDLIDQIKMHSGDRLKPKFIVQSEIARIRSKI
jgi:hypothetical protein